VRPGAVAKRLVARVARELDLPEDWVNDDVKQFLAEKEAKREWGGTEFGDGLRVSVPTAQYLLALKLRACRPPLPGYAGDYEDIRFLVRKMALRSVAAAEKIHDLFFPHDELAAAAKEVVASALPTDRR